MCYPNGAYIMVDVGATVRSWRWECAISGSTKLGSLLGSFWWRALLTSKCSECLGNEMRMTLNQLSPASRLHHVRRMTINSINHHSINPSYTQRRLVTKLYDIFALWKVKYNLLKEVMGNKTGKWYSVMCFKKQQNQWHLCGKYGKSVSIF